MLLSLLPLQLFALIHAATPVDVTLYDANRDETHHILIARDGTISAEDRKELQHAFRCRRSEREHKMDAGLLAMIADVAEHFDGATIEYVSAYRNYRGESKTSPHRAARAFDFRVQHVSLIAVRDYAWKHFREVGVGWYPGDDFVHMDHRPGEADIAWTEKHGTNRYHPSWSKRVRRADTKKATSRTSGS
jgi:uncharacterized protein YcbK (DUF882 family)